mgnify:CR=1 FL=1
MWTRIPVTRLNESESERLKKLDKTLEKRVIGQEEAIQALSKAVKRGRVGLKDPARPIGSFLFLGPTGVGKTELSKALAEALFGNEEDMIRVDMSEYMEKHSVSKMIGSPPGYVGHEDGGQLSEKVRRNPYSVICLMRLRKHIRMCLIFYFRYWMTDILRIRREESRFPQYGYHYDVQCRCQGNH